MIGANTIRALAPRACLPPLWREIIPIVSGVCRMVLAPEEPRIDNIGSPVLLIPGLFAGDSSLRPLRKHLERAGHNVWESSIDCNVACSEATAARLAARLMHIADRTESRVAIVGHSRGGLLGRVLAHRHPELVSGLVTLGSPVRDQLAVHPLLWVQMAALAALGSLGKRDLVRLECAVSTCCERFREDLVAPVHKGLPQMAVYSRRDGVVDWRACRDAQAFELEVTSTHCGMPTDALVKHAVSGAIHWFGANVRSSEAPNFGFVQVAGESRHEFNRIATTNLKGRPFPTSPSPSPQSNNGRVGAGAASPR